MKKIQQIKKVSVVLLLWCSASVPVIGQIRQAKIGDNLGSLTAPNSTVLELESTSKALVLPRVASTASITTPVPGLIVFDLSENCIKGYQNNVWTGCNFLNFVSKTGKTWMDRNLGAAQVATSATDYLAYGDLYQWGRPADGHQKIVWVSGNLGYAVNGTTSTKSTTDVPLNSLFITGTDWRSTVNDNLWQGVNGINNPCPSGFRVPTEAEFQAEVTAYGITTISTAFNSPFKFTSPGLRGSGTGALLNPFSLYYWTSTPATSGQAKYLFGNGVSFVSTIGPKGFGCNVRCIKG